MRLTLGLGLPPGGGSGVGADALLFEYDQGFALDADSPDGLGYVSVKDTGTPANNLSNVAAHQLITQSGTSPKLVKQQDGTLAWSPHNLAPNSADLTAWFNDGTTDTGNTVVAPDGTTTGDTLTAQVRVADDARIVRTITLVAGATATYSIYVKPGTHDYVFFGYAAASEQHAIGVFDLSDTGATEASETDVGTTSGTITSTSQTYDASTGWFRISITASCGAADGAIQLGFAAAATGNSFNAIGIPVVTTAGTETFYAWGANAHRGSTLQTYIPTTTAAVFYPAFEWDASPDTGSARWRMLVEPAATNLILASNDPTGTGWNLQSGASRAVNAAVAPDGTTTAGSITPAAAASAGLVLWFDPTFSNDTNYTFSGYFKKAATLDWIMLTVRNQAGANFRAWFDITNGVKGTSSGSPVGYDVDDLGNGWVRCWITIDSGTGATVERAYISLVDDDGNVSFDNTGGSDSAYMWGVQLETGTAATSPTPTYGATVTRAADDPETLLSALPFSATVGALSAEVASIGNAGFQWAVTVDDGQAESIGLYIDASGNGAMWARDGGTTQVNSTGSGAAFASGATAKMAMAWAANDFALSEAGAAVVTDTSATLPTPTKLQFGPALFAGQQLPLYIDTIRYIPQRVPNATLQGWTA